MDSLIMGISFEYISNIITVASFVLLVSNILIVFAYSKQCEYYYNIPSRFFKVDFVDRFLFVGINMFLAILLLNMKSLDGWIYIIMEMMCYIIITILFLITIEEYKFKYQKYIIFGLLYSIVYIILNVIFNTSVYNYFIKFLFILLWFIIVIKKTFLFNPLKEPKYYIKSDGIKSKNYKIVLSTYNDYFLIVDGMINKKNKNLELYTKEYEFIKLDNFKLIPIPLGKSNEVIVINDKAKEKNRLIKFLNKIVKKNSTKK